MGPLDAFDLSGRVALITGAGSGIGRASAEVLAGAGAHVVCADIDEARARETADAVGGTARRVDVSRVDEVDELVSSTAAEHGRLDVMGNIAGIIQTSNVVDTTDADLERILDVNLRGVFYGCRAAARVMTAQGSGSIINMSSGAIDTPAPGHVAYGISKAAVAQLTRTLASEVGANGVRVNAIAPGFVVTNMTSRHFLDADGTVDDERRDATLKMMGRLSPLRTVGQPEDIAYAVLYLASDAARFVTGQILRPNGGMAMPW